MPLFTNPAITDLKEHVQIAMPWEKHYKLFKAATGLPPQVIIYSYLKGLKEDINVIPQKLEQILESRKIVGQLSLDQITRAVEQGPRWTAMANDLLALRSMIQ